MHCSRIFGIIGLVEHLSLCLFIMLDLSVFDGLPASSHCVFLVVGVTAFRNGSGDMSGKQMS